mgnify:CR=1 FL=1
MTIGPEQIATHEEPLLAEYLIARVCDRASGRAETECTRDAPRDRYFIGSLRPRPPEPEGDQRRPRLPDEVFARLAPMAFGLEARVGSSPESTVAAVVTLRWACYYRVFPTLDEQRRHQQGMPSDQHEPAQQQDSQAEVGDHLPGLAPPSDNDSGAGGRRRRRDGDTLFPKWRKIQCSASAEVRCRRLANGLWQTDTEALDRSTSEELARARGVVLHDPEHLRTADDRSKMSVPLSALASDQDFSRFKSTFRLPAVPLWRWNIRVEVRYFDGDGEPSLELEFTNSSSVAPDAWELEGFFFDVGTTLEIVQGRLLPFELDIVPKGFRYDRSLWGRGFNCGILAEPPAGSRVDKLVTTNSPVFRQMRYVTNDEPTARFDDLAGDPVPVLRRIASAMRAWDTEWESALDAYRASDPDWETHHGAAFSDDRQKFRDEITRFERGADLVERDADVRLAFQLANRAMRQAGNKTAWRLFQIVFLVSQIPGIASLRDTSSPDAADRAIVDIVYFPTGGGKTEAYLGVIVFHLFFDRLRGKTAGVTAWTRFPLRLLTLQQTQRVSDVIAAAELIRRSAGEARLAGRTVDGFAVGFLAGEGATPNKLVRPFRNQADAQWSTALDPAARQRWKIVARCPSCRTASVRIDFDEASARLVHRCTNASCAFPSGDLPVVVVDNEIFRTLPSVIVGTIDKLAGVGMQRKMSLILGVVTGRCELHGYYNGKCCQDDCTDQRRLRAGPPSGVSGPTLFVQDELHLLKENLGTFDAHYETFLQELLRELGMPAVTKVIASSATIEAFERQAFHLYGRQARAFPGLGPTLRQSFYARTLSHPQRLFVGTVPHNKTIFNAMLELIQYLYEETTQLRRMTSGPNPYGGQIEPGGEQWNVLVDLYVTQVTYFLAKRDLTQTRTDLESHTNSLLEDEGLERLRIAELYDRTSTDEVARILEALETGDRLGRPAPNVVLATSMISHGVDVDRLNAMFFYGMPRQNAEYIQASSRVGRSHAGIVFVCMHPTRERDRSHFTYFGKYHEYLGKLVEPVAINRWSKFSAQRTMPGLFMAILLQSLSRRGTGNPNRFYMVDHVRGLITQGALRAEDFLGILERGYLVDRPEAPVAANLRAEIGNTVRRFLDQIIAAGGQGGLIGEVLVPRPMRSLRDVDEPVAIEIDSNGEAWMRRTSGANSEEAE